MRFPGRFDADVSNPYYTGTKRLGSEAGNSENRICDMTIEFETERLILRRIALEDTADFLDLNSDPEVVRYAENRVMKSLDEAREALIKAPLADYDKYGYGRLAVVHKDAQEMIGFCGMKYLPELGLNEIGYRYKRRFWGQGLATEAGEATLNYARDTLGLDYVIALILEGNIGSVRVAEKLGMKKNGTVRYLEFDAMKYERYLLGDEAR